jgi:hypothetical protein
MRRTRHDTARRQVALLAAASLLVSPMTPLLEAQAPTTTAPAQAKAPATPAAPKAPATTEPAVSLTKVPTTAKAAAPAAKAAAPQAPPPVDLGWPRAYTTASGGHVVLYQPQVSDWAGQKHMTAYSAVSWQPKGAAKPSLGTVKVETDTRVSLADRLVKFSVLKITEANFPQVPKEQIREVTDEIDKAIPDEERIIGLDRVLASIPARSSPRRSRASWPIRRPFSTATPVRSWSTSTASRSGARSRRTTSSSPSTRTGTCSSTRRPRPSTCVTKGTG